MRASPLVLILCLFFPLIGKVFPENTLQSSCVPNDDMYLFAPRSTGTECRFRIVQTLWTDVSLAYPNSLRLPMENCCLEISMQSQIPTLSALDFNILDLFSSLDASL